MCYKYSSNTRRALTVRGVSGVDQNARRADARDSKEDSMLKLRSFFAVALVAIASVALAGDATAGGKPAAGNKDDEKKVVATMEASAAPKIGDAGWADWKAHPFSLDVSKGTIYFGVRVKAGNRPTDILDLQVKVQRGPDEVVTRKNPKSGKSEKKTIPGKPEMVAMLPTETPAEANSRPGYEMKLHWAPEPIDGLAESGDPAKGDKSALWVSTTNPDAKGDTPKHPILGCVELVVDATGEISFRLWKYEPKLVISAAGSGEGKPAPKAPEPPPPAEEGKPAEFDPAD